MNNTKNTINESFKAIVLSGGALNGFMILGALHYYESCLPNIKFFIGTSIGSIICYLLCLGYKPIEILEKCILMDINNLISSNINLSNIIKNYGLSSLDTALHQIQLLTKSKLDYVPSLSELYTETGNELTICTYNLSLQKVEYKNRHTDPHLSCLDALKMSSNIPFLFEKCIYDNCLYVDGGFVDNFPIKWADNYINQVESKDKEWDNLENTELNILAVNIKSTPEEIKLNKMTLVNYIKSLAHIPFHINIKEYQSLSVKIHHLTTDEFLLELTTEKAVELFNIGHNTIKTEMKNC